MVVVPGRSEQFWQWFHATHMESKAVSVNRGSGTILMEDGTKYQCVTRVERAMGLPREVPVIAIGTYTNEKHEIIEHLQVRGSTVTYERY